MNKPYVSQFGEDRVLSWVFRRKPRGRCVEVGANDGQNDSTTLLLERKGWDCVLVEPNPELCSLIRQVRRARVFECAASSQVGTAVLNIAVGPGRAHGVSSVGEDDATRSRIAGFGFDARQVTVQTRTLDDLLQEAEFFAPIDFVSIDVEGHELEVLKGFDMARWRPRLMLMEDNSNHEDLAVPEYLREQGYVQLARTGVNDWYAHASDSLVRNSALRFALGAVAKYAAARTAFPTKPGFRRLARFLNLQ